MTVVVVVAAAVAALVGFDSFQSNRILHCRGNRNRGLRERQERE